MAKIPLSIKRTIEVREIACLLGSGVTVVQTKTSDAGITRGRIIKWVLERCCRMNTLI